MKINFTKKGSGQPLLLIHGVWMSSKFFHKNIDELSKHYCVYSIDLPGHGDSQKLDGNHTVTCYTKELHNFIESENLSNMHLLGWSMGCFVIWEYLKTYGESNVASTICVSQGPTDFQWSDWPQGPFSLDSLLSMFRQTQTNIKELFSSFLPLMFKSSLSKDDSDWMLKENLKLTKNIASSILIDQSTKDYRDFLVNIDSPTLLCWGRDEKCVSISDGEFINSKISNSQLIIFEESGHCPFLEEPEKFNMTIISFLKSYS